MNIRTLALAALCLTPTVALADSLSDVDADQRTWAQRDENLRLQQQQDWLSMQQRWQSDDLQRQQNAAPIGTWNTYR
jgi:hypothetical protein